MLSSPSASVSYEASWTLVSLSSAPTAVRAAAKTYAGLLNSQSDNNIKLIVLEKLEELKGRHTKVLQEILMDILRALSSPNPDICKKVSERSEAKRTSLDEDEPASSKRSEFSSKRSESEQQTKRSEAKRSEQQTKRASCNNVGVAGSLRSQLALLASLDKYSR